MVFSNKPYDSEKAQRRFLQMPAVSVNVGSGVYLCEKKQGMSFGSVKDELDGMLHSLPKPNLMSSEEFNEILYTSENDAERNRIKHTICSAYNLSRRQASSLYNISRFKNAKANL